MSDPQKPKRALLRGPCDECKGPGGEMCNHPLTLRKKLRLCQKCFDRWMSTIGAMVKEISAEEDERVFKAVTEDPKLYRTNEEKDDADEIRDNGDIRGGD